MPTMTYSNGKLRWTSKSGLTYKLWTGKEYVDVSGGSYTVDTSVYGCYSLMAISSDGVCSELSQPIVISPDRIKIEAESGSVSSSSLISSGYVIDNRSRSANLTLSVTINKKGKYLLSGIYNNAGDATSGVSCAIRSVYVDGKDMGSLIFPEVYSDHKDQTSTHLSVDLDKGTHTIKIFYDTANWYDRNMSITKNNVQYNYFNLDYVGSGEQPPTEPPTETQAPTTPPTTPPTEATEPTEAVQLILGDADLDNKVTVLDATAIQKKLASIEVTSFSEKAADVDADKKVTILDATYIQKYLASMDVPEGIGKPIA